MREKLQSKKGLISIIIVVIGIGIIGLLGFFRMQAVTKIGYVGSESQDSWFGSYTTLDGIILKNINSEKEMLRISVETELGAISVEIKDKENRSIFKKENMKTGFFDVKVSGELMVQIKAKKHKGSFDISYQDIGQASVGQIFLYGEEHAVGRILEREFELWSSYYQEGIRDLFVELPYYTAEYMNIWMQADNDEILDALYQDWAGTAIYSEEVLDFYKRIKRECPETVFHGTDVGHQYNTIGERFLKYLKENGQEGSKVYQLSQENIEQGKYYYQHSDQVYRENKMAENFVRELEDLNGKSVMGIYGLAHTRTDAMDYATNTVPCMANQLYQKYGNALYTEDLTLLNFENETYQMDYIKIGEKEYSALYIGKVDLSKILPDYQYREFWVLEDAYDDFKENPVTGNLLPYNNYPMKIELGQIVVIEYKKTDGSIIREYHRSDGNTWQGSLVTEEFLITSE